MKDQLVKALVLDGRVRIYADRTTDMVREAQDRFDLWPVATAALGRVLSVASIMGSMLKSDKEMLTISINGHGPAGSIIVDAYQDGNVRGFISNPHVETENKAPGKMDVGAAVGKEGTLTVTKDLHMSENWTGTVDLQSGEIGDDFAYYFTMSEQTPSAVSVGVSVGPDGKVEAAGAMIIQMMPDATDEDISICEHVISGLKPMSTLIKDYDDVNLSDLINDMFENANILETTDIKFSCPCSKESSERVLMTLPKAEVESLFGEGKDVEVTCNFCNEHYTFTPGDLKGVLDRMDENQGH